MLGSRGLPARAERVLLGVIERVLLRLQAAPLVKGVRHRHTSLRSALQLYPVDADSVFGGFIVVDVAIHAVKGVYEVGIVALHQRLLIVGRVVHVLALHHFEQVVALGRGEHLLELFRLH